MFSSRPLLGALATAALSGHLVSVEGAEPSVSLPSIKSIAAGGDVRAFLKPGVPTDLACAALHIAWTSDPVIRDFVGIGDNDWDFNAQDGIPGFGALEQPDIEVQVTSSEIWIRRK
jgi:hypothetical protein